MSPLRAAPVRVAGVDASLTSTGIATSWGVLTVVKPRGDMRGPARLDHIEREVVSMIAGADVVVLEGYSLGSVYQQNRGTAMVFTGELGGVLRLAFWRCGVPYVEIAPSKLKVFATGSGKGDAKGGILSEAVRRLGYAGTSHDEADALWLLQVGLHAYQHPQRVALPALHLRALEATRGQEPIDWPEVANG